MPQPKPIIFLKGKLRDDIKSFGFNEKSGQYYVKFKNGDDEQGDEYNYLSYKPENVDVAEFSRQLEPPLRVIRKTDGYVFSNVLGVRVYEGRDMISWNGFSRWTATVCFRPLSPMIIGQTTW